MNALALVHVLLVASGDPCAAILDRTDACAAPADVPTNVVSDAKPTPEAPSRDPLLITSQLSLAAAGVAALGGGALVWTQLEGGPAAVPAERRDAVRTGGISALAVSGAIAAATVALLVFDPSTGKMRISFESGD
jgi:hypothetical protein